MEGNLMGRIRSIHAARPSAARGGGTSSLLWPALAWLLPVALVTILFTCTPGCANQRLTELYNGTGCSAENVQAYAKEHGLSYEQALGELRKQEQQLWAEEEARQNSVGSRQ